MPHDKGISGKKPRKILDFPLKWWNGSLAEIMTDLFMEGVSDEMINQTFRMMAKAKQHTFQILTKRADRMFKYVGDRWGTFDGREYPPLPNVHLGVSVESQEYADERIPLLLKTPAAVRFLSVEPLLGPVNLEWVRHGLGGESFKVGSVLTGDDGFGLNAPRNRIDWVIVGGESGRGARPMHPKWAHDLRDQCVKAAVPFFFKQWGEYEPMTDAEGYGYYLTTEESDAGIRSMTRRILVAEPEGRVVEPKPTRQWWDDYQAECWTRYHQPEDPDDDMGVPWAMHRVGKKQAGRLLDGREWNELPVVAGAES